MLVPRHARIAHRAEVHGGIVAPERVHEPVREDRPVEQVAFRAEIEPVELQGQTTQLREPREEPHADPRDLGSDSVAGDDRDALGHARAT